MLQKAANSSGAHTLGGDLNTNQNINIDDQDDQQDDDWDQNNSNNENNDNNNNNK